MKTLNSVFIVVIMIFAVLKILLLEWFVKDFFLIPFIETIIIFFSILLITKVIDEGLSKIVFFSSFVFFCLETVVYLIYSYTGLVNSIPSDVFAWRFVYGFFFTMIWIPVSCYGLKFKEKILWFFFLFLGCLIHLLINVLMSGLS